MLNTVEYELEILKKGPQTYIFKDILTKSSIPCLFQAAGPFPLDSDRISDPFWSWKCTDPSQKQIKRFLVHLN